LYHENYSFCTVLDDANGAGSEWTYRGALYPCRVGRLAMMEPGEVHATRAVHGPGTFRVLDVSPALMATVVEEIGPRPGLPHLRQADVVDADVVAAFVRFHRTLERGASALEQQARLAGCLRAVLTRCAESPPAPAPTVAPPGLCKARELIHDEYLRDIELDEVAGVAGLSRYHVCRAFTREFGLPPHAYQRQLRLRLVRSLVASGHALADVAVQAGFSDQSHMTRAFHTTFGVSPGAYRRMLSR
jgi:AraC-like DNA-binding protein